MSRNPSLVDRQVSSSALHDFDFQKFCEDWYAIPVRLVASLYFQISYLMTLMLTEFKFLTMYSSCSPVLSNISIDIVFLF
jgi:hypothetical protein